MHEDSQIPPHPYFYVCFTLLESQSKCMEFKNQKRGMGVRRGERWGCHGQAAQEVICVFFLMSVTHFPLHTPPTPFCLRGA